MLEEHGIDILNAVAEWKVNASSEDMGRYFFRFSGFEKISSGDITFVVGRKGAGKTAIISYIDTKQDFDWFCRKISLAAFPVERLTELFQQTFLRSNSYILGWKYVIYNSLLDAISTNEAIHDDARLILDQRKPLRTERKLESTFNRWKSRGFSASIGDNPLFGGFSVSASTDIADVPNIPIADQVSAMEDFLFDYIDDSKYFVLFDGLDSEFSSITQGKIYWEQYQLLIAGLFKACLEVRDIFRTAGKKVIPISFTRDDIFELVHDSDKGKWYDHVYELRWRRDEIRNLLAYRISKAVDPDGPSLNFDDAWRMLFFPSDKVRIRKDESTRSYKSAFDYILLRSLLRPRDFITYLQICAKITKEHNEQYTRINPVTVSRSEYTYSCRIRQELVDEIFPLLPPIENLFKALDKLPHYRYFNYEQIVDLLDLEKENGNIETQLNVAQILALLFKYSAIGNSRRFKRKTDSEATYYRTFSHLKPRSALDITKPMAIHSSLFASIFSSRAEMYDNTADKNVIDTEEPPTNILSFETKD